MNDFIDVSTAAVLLLLIADVCLCCLDKEGFNKEF